jgi:DNA-binding transcriptional MocR family regulator
MLRLLNPPIARMPSGRRARHPGIASSLRAAIMVGQIAAGGFVAWLELPKTVDAVALYRRALAEGISIAPGPLFSARERYRHFVRLNFARGWNERTVGAMTLLGRLTNA